MLPFYNNHRRQRSNNEPPVSDRLESSGSGWAPNPCTSPTCSTTSSSPSISSSVSSPSRLDMGLHRRRGSGASDSSTRSPQNPLVSTTTASSSPLSNSFQGTTSSTVKTTATSPNFISTPNNGHQLENVNNCSCTRSDAPSELQHVRVIRNASGIAVTSPFSPSPCSSCKIHSCSSSRRHSKGDRHDERPPYGNQVQAAPGVRVSTTVATTPPPKRQQRLQSLDLLRGISIVLMILVNTQGADPFEQLAHSTWFGYTLADWVFPNFIFMVGVAVALVFNPKRLSVLSSVNNSTGPWHQRHRKRLLASGKILKRSLYLFLLGISLALLELIGLPRNGLWLRVPGVLQRIALCYLVLALSVLWTDSNRRPPSTLKESAFRSWKLPLICTGLWFLIMFAVKSTATEPIEECRYPASAYSSSGLVQSGNAPSRGQLSPPLCTAQAFLDTVLFTLDRDTNHPIVDAEGTVGSLMAIVSGWFGWMLGRMLLVQQQSSAAMVKNTTRLRDFEQRQLEDSVDNAAPNCPSNQSRLWSGCSMTANSETTRTDVIQVWSDHHTKTDPTIPCASEQQQQQAIDETRGGSTSSTQTVESTTMGEAMNKIDHSQRQFMLAHMTEWLMAGVSLTLAGTVLDWVLPICKGLWTPSFALYSAGLSTFALCSLLYLFDLPPVTIYENMDPGSSPARCATLATTRTFNVRTRCCVLWYSLAKTFRVLGQGCIDLVICYGRNPTLIFMLSEALKIILEKIPVHTDQDWIQSVWSYLFFKSFIQVMPAPWASLVFSLVYIVLFAPLMWFLNSKVIYLRV